MIEKKKKVEKSEQEILYPDIEVAGFKVRPWSFDQFFDMLPIFLQGSDILKANGISLEDFEGLAKERDTKKILSLLSVFRPIIPEVVSKTIGIEIETVKKMEFDRVISIALVILIQNAERIKNFSGLGKKAMETLTIS